MCKLFYDRACSLNYKEAWFCVVSDDDLGALTGLSKRRIACG